MGHSSTQVQAYCQSLWMDSQVLDQFSFVASLLSVVVDHLLLSFKSIVLVVSQV